MAEPVYYTAYMDETGHAAADDQLFCGMAGFIAPAEDWEIFEGKWKRVLRDFKIPYFHMREFAHSVGVFEGWKGKEAKRQKLFGSLLNKIAAIHPIPLGSITSLEAYRNLTPEDQIVYHDPYLRGLADCAGLPGMLLKDAPPEVKYAVVFSEQAEFRHRAESVYQVLKQYFSFSHRMMYPDFKDMRDLVPLQAADIIAYELHKEFERQLYKPDKEPRHGYKELEKMAKRVRPDWNPFVFHDEKKVRSHVAKLKSQLAELGMSAPDYGQAWRWLYAQPILRPEEEK